MLCSFCASACFCCAPSCSPLCHLFFPLSLFALARAREKKGGQKKKQQHGLFRVAKDKGPGSEREESTAGTIGSDDADDDMWLRPVPPKRTPANKTSVAVRPRYAHTRQTTARAAPMATRVADHSGSSDDDNDDCVQPSHRIVANAAACARTAPSKIAHMIAPIDAAGSATAQSSARRHRPPTALATSAPQRADGARDLGRVLTIDRDAHQPSHKRRMPHDVRQDDHAEPKGRGPHTVQTLNAGAQEDAYVKPPLATAAATTTAATGHVSTIRPYQRTGRGITKGMVSIGKRSGARGIASHPSLSDRNDDNNNNNNNHDDRDTDGWNGGNDDDNGEKDAQDGTHDSATDRTHTSNTDSTDSSGDDEHQDHDSTEWAAFQAAALARARCDVVADQRRAAHRLADALAALRIVMERAWTRGQLVSSSSVADAEARARAFLRAGCCCAWEPAAAPLSASLSALVSQLAIDRPQEPTPCFVALLDALAAAVRLIAASDESAAFGADDLAQSAKQHAELNSGPQRRDHHSRSSPGLPTHRDNDLHDVAVGDTEPDVDNNNNNKSDNTPGTEVVARRDNNDSNSKDDDVARDDGDDKSPRATATHEHKEASDAVKSANDDIGI